MTPEEIEQKRRLWLWLQELQEGYPDLVIVPGIPDVILSAFLADEEDRAEVRNLIRQINRERGH